MMAGFSNDENTEVDTSGSNDWSDHFPGYFASIDRSVRGLGRVRIMYFTDLGPRPKIRSQLCNEYDHHRARVLNRHNSWGEVD